MRSDNQVKAALAALCVIATAGFAPALAQYPQKPITIIAPFAPGASADGVARLLAQHLSTRLGQPVVVENKPGAGGASGLLTVAKSPPDGYVLGVGASGAMVIAPHTSEPPPFDPLKDLAPVANLISPPIVLVTSPTSGLATLKAVIDTSKSRPGGLNYGSAGSNTAQHLSAEMFKKATGANLTHVPYRGSTPAVTDVLGGQIPIASVDLTSASAFLSAKTLVGLAVWSGKRSVLIPDVPTADEGGVKGFATQSWIGLFAPAGTPTPIVTLLAHEARAILDIPDVKAKLAVLAAEPTYMDTAEFTTFIAAESAKWRDIIKTLPTN